MKFSNLAIAAMAIFVAVFARPSYADEFNFVSALTAGDWKGDGTLHRTPTAPTEKVRCRFLAKFHRGASVITMRYICRGIDISFETFGNLEYNQKDNTVTGELTTVGRGDSRATGIQKDKKVVLTMTGKDEKTGKPTKATMEIEITGENSMKSTVTANDLKTGKPFEVFTGSFQR